MPKANVSYFNFRTQYQAGHVAHKSVIRHHVNRLQKIKKYDFGVTSNFVKISQFVQKLNGEGETYAYLFFPEKENRLKIHIQHVTKIYNRNNYRCTKHFFKSSTLVSTQKRYESVHIFGSSFK
jgi:hypothetical protein